MLSNAILAVGGLAALSSAHVLISTPIPFSVPALHNGPLAADGSDFPCQNTGGGYQVGSTNVMALGSTQPLNFIGTAVHGGGSCQISITYDTAPNKNSVWKVIHSIEGGCPAKNTPGNLGNDPNFKVPFDYSFPLPTDIPAGNATIAWTWLNKIGNREYYMNCAPVQLTGAGGPKSNWEALPDMLKANIGNGCTTKEGFDYKYPNPGKSVESFATGQLIFPDGNCGPSGPSGGTPDSGNGGGAPAPAPGGGSGAPSGGAGSGGGYGGSPAPSAAPPSPSKGGAPGGGGVFITVSTPASGPQETAAPQAPPAAPAPPAAAPPAAAPPTAPSAPSSGGGFAPGTACSPEGQWNCIGGTSFQRCASGTWSAVMAVSAGTTCKVGASSAMEIDAVSSKKRRVALPFRG
ncbi:putative chitin domain 3 protein [Echria macrotheca]|uniref:Chitin domain 3 protein n=1 Tax=Echria macrotheca TaxID=438768 RepID=A0AAJ0BNY5_9PEZI|nr:putative chitin domain 3 protein [Echria macrotheca]